MFEVGKSKFAEDFVVDAVRPSPIVLQPWMASKRAMQVALANAFFIFNLENSTAIVNQPLRLARPIRYENSIRTATSSKYDLSEKSSFFETRGRSLFISRILPVPEVTENEINLEASIVKLP